MIGGRPSLLCGLRLLLACLAWQAAAAIAVAQPTSPVSEYSLKAVLLYRLPSFTYWTDSNRLSNSLCIVGSNPFAGQLERIAAETSDSRRLDIRQLTASTDWNGCDVLFIGRSESSNLEGHLRRADSRRGLLTVSDIPGFAKQGGMVEMTMTGDRVGVQINRKMAQKQGLDFSAQLLRLAQWVAQ